VIDVGRCIANPLSRRPGMRSRRVVYNPLDRVDDASVFSPSDRVSYPASRLWVHRSGVCVIPAVADRVRDALIRIYRPSVLAFVNRKDRTLLLVEGIRVNNLLLARLDRWVLRVIRVPNVVNDRARVRCRA